MNWLDIVIIVILALSAWIGLRTGIIKVVALLIGLIIGIVLNVITTYEGIFSSGLTKVAIGGLLLAFVLLQRVPTRRSDATP